MPIKSSSMYWLRNDLEIRMSEIPKRNRNERQIVNSSAAIYCDQNLRMSRSWIVKPTLPIRDKVPFVEKIKVAKMVTTRTPPLLIVKMSLIVEYAASKLVGGRAPCSNSKTCSWNPSSGIKGISVKSRSMPGKRAKKKEKLIAAARVVTAPSIMPLKKKMASSYKLSPSKNGSMMRFAWFAINSLKRAHLFFTIAR